jgi:hypothetical protein
MTTTGEVVRSSVNIITGFRDFISKMWSRLLTPLDLSCCADAGDSTTASTRVETRASERDNLHHEVDVEDGLCNARGCCGFYWPSRSATHCPQSPPCICNCVGSTVWFWAGVCDEKGVVSGGSPNLALLAIVEWPSLSVYLCCGGLIQCEGCGEYTW